MSLFLGNLLAVAVAALHVYFCVMEMLLWRGRARKVFRTTEDFANQTAGLAANQGLYNLFLTAGIGYGLLTGNVAYTSFTLGCVVVAGVFGALTASMAILYVQALPAVAALVLVQFGANGVAGALPTLTAVAAFTAVFGFALGKHVGDREKPYQQARLAAFKAAKAAAAAAGDAPKDS